MAAPQKLINGLTDLGMEKIQEYLDYYSELVNKGEKSFSEALDELVDIEKKNKQVRRDTINLHIANFPFIKTLDDFDFNFQPNLNRKELLELSSLGFVENNEYSCAMKSQFRQSGNHKTGTGNHPITYASLLA